jgi:hypothetical protein
LHATSNCYTFILRNRVAIATKSVLINAYCKGADLSQKKPYKNDTRKLSNRTISKRICKHKAIVKCKQGIDKQLLNVKVIDYKYTSDMK